jgi:hypothetical protein
MTRCTASTPAIRATDAATAWVPLVSSRRARPRVPSVRTIADEGTIVNTTLTATRSTAQQAEAVRARAGRLRERLARRTGLALLAWSRAAEARRLREDADPGRRARLQHEADRLREANFTAVALLARTH